MWFDQVKGGFPEGGLPKGGLPGGGLPEGALPESGLPGGGLPRGGLPKQVASSHLYHIGLSRECSDSCHTHHLTITTSPWSSPLPQIPSPPLPVSSPVPVSPLPLPASPTYPLGYRSVMIWLRAETPSTSHPLPSSTPPSGTPPLLPIPLPTPSTTFTSFLYNM
ncbi:hypothetical protein Tco_1465037 [Tanacetum coccineum]